MDLKLSGQTALVTGSTGGIGQAIAEGLAAEGARVVVCGRGETGVGRAIRAIRDRLPAADLVPLAADQGTAEGCATTIAAHPSVDILVNNLGIYEAVGFFDETDEAWRRLFEVNILSGVRLARHYLAGMLERKRGRILFISSESGISPAPEMAHYSATKTMQLSISRSLAELTKGTAVTVNTVLPGSTLTEGVQAFLADLFPGTSPPEAEARFMSENRPTSLIQRLIRPEEIAAAVTFLASPLASAVNGATLRVDGGLVRNIV
ncbi:3-oxoacyl-[acyl-carrier-protein] reductase FabG [Aquisphaera giovannonii]|uniref:3-oxoacyl-[acyl-carrier-protein] reductase FabG n=1 Tax=Aquisphaera giovannonii TaxID=406548 RepID=A0A5B9VW86_9BACT|nr:SDR family oxidoreductase [Aquisphaera giovannonii]QEH32726.1 3-oxoacyl-[acyl-carrier-protein] reductase FabG [Aquisphaera giovannonii]